ncbi:MAG TPA: selenium cofactor biosynthesis protein YqeC [Tepidiformaceae bacterium]|nr:selenium cofactor biosynthesis protein YqeC [Tepidiformaceae bacterium]
MDLFEAFAFRPGTAVAAVGGGGRTALAYGVALEAASRGLPAVVVPTVRSTGPEHGSAHRLCQAADATLADDAAAAPPGVAIAMVGARDDHGEFPGFSLDAAGCISLPGGLLAIDGDGARTRWFKAPGPHEPAIPANATDVVICVGLEVLGKPLSDAWVHRPGIVSDLAGAAPGAPVTADIVLRVLLHEEGGMKNVPRGARLHALLDNPVTDEHLALANHIAARLVYGGFSTAVIATAERPGAIHGVVR